MADYLQASYDEVEEFYKAIFDSKTPRVQKYMVYTTYKDAKEKQTELQKIEKSYRDYILLNGICYHYATGITDGFAVIYTICNNEPYGYIPCFYDKNHKILDITPKEYKNTIEDALLLGLCIKNGRDAEAFKWVKRLITKENNEDKGEI